MGTATHVPALEAFQPAGPVFDAIDRGERAPIGAHAGHRAEGGPGGNMQPGERLLELNAGTGIDSLFFRAAGLQVLATDAAPGMLAQLEARRNAHPELRLAVQERSFPGLDTLPASASSRLQQFRRHQLHTRHGTYCSLAWTIAAARRHLRPGDHAALRSVELLAAEGAFPAGVPALAEGVRLRRWRRVLPLPLPERKCADCWANATLALNSGRWAAGFAAAWEQFDLKHRGST